MLKYHDHGDMIGLINECASTNGGYKHEYINIARSFDPNPQMVHAYPVRILSWQCRQIALYLCLCTEKADVAEAQRILAYIQQPQNPFKINGFVKYVQSNIQFITYVSVNQKNNNKKTLLNHTPQPVSP